MRQPVWLVFASLKFRGVAGIWLRRTCPPPDSGRGRGLSDTSYREAMTQETMGGAGEEDAKGVRNGVPPETDSSTPLVLCDEFVNDVALLLGGGIGFGGELGEAGGADGEIA